MRCGVDRIELCSNLVDGGVTPSPGLILGAVECRDAVFHETGHLCRVNVLIRPRGGDFVYSDAELEIIEKNIAFCKQAQCDGVVVGVLTPDGAVDIIRTSRLTVR